MTRNSDDKKGKIGTDVISSLYTSPKLFVLDAHPHFILHRDTLRAFLFEKQGLFGLRERVIGWIGIEISLITTLIISTFHDWRGIPAAVLQAVFIVVAGIIAILFTVDCFKLIRYRGDLSIDTLSDELGTRGAVLKPEQLEEVEK